MPPPEPRCKLILKGMFAATSFDVQIPCMICYSFSLSTQFIIIKKGAKALNVQFTQW
jgi:hypothetical protein